MLDLRQRLRGEVIDADDARYDITRALYNGMIDKKPRTIIRCTSAADVINAVAYGRETGLPIATTVPASPVATTA